MKKISLSKIDELLKNYCDTEPKTIKAVMLDEGEVDIRVTPVISLADQEDIVNYVANTVCSIDKNGAMEFRPMLLDVAFAAAVLLNYTNLKIEGSIERVNKFLYSSLYNNIKEIINKEQLWAIERAIDEKIKFLMSDHQHQIDAVLAQISSIAKPLSDLVVKDNGDELSRAIGKLANIDEEKIIDTISDRTEE